MKYHIITVLPSREHANAIEISDGVFEMADYEPEVRDGVLILRDSQGMASLLPPGSWKICERVRDILTPPAGLVLPGHGRNH